MPTALYSRRDVVRRMDFGEILDITERTYAEVARGRVLNPAKLTMHMGDDGAWPHENAFSIDMPAYVDWLGVAGTKWAVATWDADAEIPIRSLILLFDLERAAFESVMEGMHITGVRTAMQSVVGLKNLYPGRVGSIGVFGAGFQSEFQVLVIDHLLDVETFELFDIDRAAARDLAGRVAPDVDAEIVVGDSPDATAKRDAIITATDSKTPVLEDHWLEASNFVIALGSYRELADETVLGADRIVVDDVDQCLQRGALSSLAERGELTRADIDATIGAVLDGESDESIEAGDSVVFVPIGLGALDVSIAEYVHHNGRSGDSVREFDFG